MLLIYSILKLLKGLLHNLNMLNLYAIFAKFVGIYKQFADNLVNEKGNRPRSGVVLRFSI
jgi:hypothetical protein